MNILLAPDKFKGSLSALEVCRAIEESLIKRYPDVVITTAPMADGGEGSHEILNSVYKASTISIRVKGPLLNPVNSTYSISSDGKTAIIEMAKASGLQLVDPESRNPMNTSTYGTGELICDALDRGVETIILGIGGSATNDAGMGMAAALGFQLFDSDGKPITPIGKHLIDLHRIESDKIHPRLKEVDFITLCDVNNPLHGEDGAAFIYAPQKGASRSDIVILDAGLQHFQKIAEAHFKTAVDFPGAGAAGGLGAGAKIYLGATIRRGIDFIAEVTGLNQKIIMADLVITGEGKLDRQSLSGKVVLEVSRLAQNAGKPVTVICGRCELKMDDLKSLGIRQIITLTNDETSVDEAVLHGYELIKKRMDENFVVA